MRQHLGILMKETDAPNLTRNQRVEFILSLVEDLLPEESYRLRVG